MLIQIGTDRTMYGGEALIRRFEAELAARLSRFSDHITRLEVHFTNPTKSRPTPERHVTVATKSFGRDCGRIGNDRHSSEDIAAADGLDRRCLIEARPEGRRPVAVSHHAASAAEACRGAAHKLESVLESAYGRAGHHKGGDSIRHHD